MAEYENQNQNENKEFPEAPETRIPETESGVPQWQDAQDQAPDMNVGNNWQETPGQNPQDGTWQNGSWQNTGNQQAWGPESQQGPYNPYGYGEPNQAPNYDPYQHGQRGYDPYNHGQPNYDPYHHANRGNGPYYNGPQTPPKKRNGFATTSLICGIVGLLNLCCFAFPTAIIMGVGAISFAIISKNNQPMTKTAIAGVVLGVITILLGIGEFFCSLWISDLMKDPQYIKIFNQMWEQIEQQLAEQAASAVK